MRSYQIKRKNNIIIGVLCAVVLLMAVGYAAFSSLLNITGTSSVSSNWDIEITNIRGGNPNGGDAYDISEPTYTPSTATFSTGLKTPGTMRVYEVEISNKGTIDGLVTIASLTVGDNDAIGFTVNEYKEKAYNDSFTSLNKTADLNIENGTNDYKDIKFYLKSTEKHYLYVSVEYKDVTTQPDNLNTNINLELNYEQAGLDENGVAIPAQTYTVEFTKEDDVTSIGSNEASCEITGGANTTCEITLPTIELTKDGYMPIWIDENGKEVGEPNNKYEVFKSQTLTASSKPYPAIIKSWGYNATTDFHTTAYKESIITAEFVDNIDVPDNAVESFDVSADSTKGKVIAWVIADETDNTKHHLYIGGKGGVVANQDSSSLFYNFKNLQTITFGNNFDTSKVTNMAQMFYNCRSLTTLDVSNFDTSNVTDMWNMFFYCESLTTLDVSYFDTSKVTKMSGMFYNCSKLTNLDVSNFDTSRVTNMAGMFSNCRSLTTLDLSNFNTSNVTSMNSMFSYCSSLTSLDVSNFDTSKVANMAQMFYNCSKLTSLDVSSFDTSNVTSMEGMFFSCQGLTDLDVSSFDTSNVTDMAQMFYYCTKLTDLDVSNFDTSKVTSLKGMFWNCNGLTTLDVSNFNTSKVTNMNNMFNNCRRLTSLDVSSFDTSRVTNMAGMFSSCSNLTTLDVSNFDTSKVTDMNGMFSYCTKLTNLDVTNFDTSKVTKFGGQYSNSGMFAYCTNLTKLNLCSFDTSSATDARNMFNNTPKLSQIYVSDKWNMANADVTDMFTNSASSSVIQSNNCMIDAGTSEITPQSSNEEVATISAEAVASDAIYNLRKVFA